MEITTGEVIALFLNGVVFGMMIINLMWTITNKHQERRRREDDDVNRNPAYNSASDSGGVEVNNRTRH